LFVLYETKSKKSKNLSHASTYSLNIGRVPIHTGQRAKPSVPGYPLQAPSLVIHRVYPEWSLGRLSATIPHANKPSRPEFATQNNSIHLQEQFHFN